MPARRTSATRRIGYVIAVVINLVLIYVASNLVDWGWPSFLTEEFNDVLWIVNLSLAVGAAANVMFFINDSRLPKGIGQIVTNVFSLISSIRVLRVFPFDFSNWGTDWSWALRTVLIIAIVGASLALLVELAKLVRPGRDGD